MRRFASNQASKADDGVVAARGRDLARGLRQFERARDPDEIDAGFGGAVAKESVDRSGDEPGGDDLVPARRDQGDLESLRV
jgi:hypothetical protein